MEQATFGRSSADPRLAPSPPRLLSSAFAAAGVNSTFQPPLRALDTLDGTSLAEYRLRSVMAAAARAGIATTQRMELIMGVTDDAKDTARPAARNATRATKSLRGD